MIRPDKRLSWGGGRPTGLPWDTPLVGRGGQPPSNVTFQQIALPHPKLRPPVRKFSSHTSKIGPGLSPTNVPCDRVLYLNSRATIVVSGALYLFLQSIVVIRLR